MAGRGLADGRAPRPPLPLWAGIVFLALAPIYAAPGLAGQSGRLFPDRALLPDLLAGPTPMGQFHGLDTTRLALGLFWNP